MTTTANGSSEAELSRDQNFFLEFDVIYSVGDINDVSNIRNLLETTEPMEASFFGNVLNRIVLIDFQKVRILTMVPFIVVRTTKLDHCRSLCVYCRSNLIRNFLLLAAQNRNTVRPRSLCSSNTCPTYFDCHESDPAIPSAIWRSVCQIVGC